MSHHKDRHIPHVEHGSRVSFATFNVLNLAMPDRDYYLGQQFNEHEFRKKVTWVAHQLHTMNADIVGFQEIFHREALEMAIKSSGVYDLSKGKASLIIGDETGNLPRVALLSRYPVTKCEVISAFPLEARLDAEGVAIPYTSFQRPVIKARVRLPNGVEAVVFVVHLKSKRPEVPEGRNRHDPWEEAAGQARSLIIRACEVAALRWMIVDELRDSETPLVLMGDLNDTTHAVTSDILQGSYPQRRYPMDVRRKLWDALLYSCSDLQVRRSFKDVYYTHLHNSQYESLDHILVSQEFVNENPRHVGAVEYLRLYNDHLLDQSLTDEPQPSWQSDHGQVLVSIKLREMCS